MGEVEIKMASGGSATVRGTPAEIAEVLRLAGIGAGAGKVAPSLSHYGVRAKRPVPARAESKAGPQARVIGLLDSGLFATKRTLADVREELGRAGHVYKATDISPVLIRLVRDRKLRRAKDESGHWTYTEW